MATSDRRSGERRGDKTAAGQKRRRERREGDRRDSYRLPVKIMVRDATLGGSFEPRDGNVSVGGVYFKEGFPPIGNEVELRFFLPGMKSEVRASGKIVKVDRSATGFGAHVQFEDLPVDTELAIAKFFDEHES